MYPGLLWEHDTTSVSTFISLLLDVLISAMLSVLKWGRVVWSCSASSMGCEFPSSQLAERSASFVRTHGLDFPSSPSLPLLIFHKNNKPQTDVNGSMHRYVYMWAVWLLRRFYWHEFGIFTSGKFTGEIMQTRLNELWRAFRTPSDNQPFRL